MTSRSTSGGRVVTYNIARPGVLNETQLPYMATVNSFAGPIVLGTFLPRKVIFSAMQPWGQLKS